MRLHGAVCLVTGASSGIGRATAKLLARRGATVLAAGAHPDRTAAVAEEVGGVPLVADLRERAGVRELAESAAAAHGRVDVLLNNAGVGWSGPFSSMPEDDIEHLLRVDLAAVMLLSRLLVPGMVTRGRGHVVGIGSIAGHAGGRNEAVYAACKAGLAMFMEALRQEHAGGPVGFSTVIPGPVDTAFFDRRGVRYARGMPRPIAPERVAAAVVHAITSGRSEVVVPGWLTVPMRLRGAVPELYRPLVDRWG